MSPRGSSTWTLADSIIPFIGFFSSGHSRWRTEKLLAKLPELAMSKMDKSLFQVPYQLDWHPTSPEPGISTLLMENLRQGKGKVIFLGNGCVRILASSVLFSVYDPNLYNVRRRGATHPLRLWRNWICRVWWQVTHGGFYDWFFLGLEKMLVQMKTKQKNKQTNKTWFWDKKGFI